MAYKFKQIFNEIDTNVHTSIFKNTNRLGKPDFFKTNNDGNGILPANTSLYKSIVTLDDYENHAKWDKPSWYTQNFSVSYSYKTGEGFGNTLYVYKNTIDLKLANFFQWGRTKMHSKFGNHSFNQQELKELKDFNQNQGSNQGWINQSGVIRNYNQTFLPRNDVRFPSIPNNQIPSTPYLIMTMIFSRNNRYSHNNLDHLMMRYIKRIKATDNNIFPYDGYYYPATSNFHQEICILHPNPFSIIRELQNPLDDNYPVFTLDTKLQELTNQDMPVVWCRESIISQREICTRYSNIPLYFLEMCYYYDVWAKHIQHNNNVKKYDQYYEGAVYEFAKPISYFELINHFDSYLGNEPYKPFIKNMLFMIFHFISTKPYFFDTTQFVEDQKHGRIERPNHGVLNQFRDFAIGQHIYKNNSFGAKVIRPYSSSNAYTQFLNTKLFTIISLASMFVSICRVDEGNLRKTLNISDKNAREWLRMLFPKIYNHCLFLFSTNNISIDISKTAGAILLKSIIYSKILSKDEINNSDICILIDFICLGLFFHNDTSGNTASIGWNIIQNNYSDASINREITSVTNTLQSNNITFDNSNITAVQIRTFLLLNSFIRLPHYIDHCRGSYTQGLDEKEMKYAVNYVFSQNQQEVAEFRYKIMLAYFDIFKESGEWGNNATFLLTQLTNMAANPGQMPSIQSMCNLLRTQGSERFTQVAYEISNNFDIAFNKLIKL